MKEEENTSKRNLALTFRIFQAIFYGIFALGVSSMLGDLGGYVKIPVSSFAITTTIFGFIGAIVTGSLAKKSKDW